MGLFVDTGLVAHRLHIGEPGAPATERKLGPGIENFAILEAHKLLAAWPPIAAGVPPMLPSLTALQPVRPDRLRGWHHSFREAEK